MLATNIAKLPEKKLYMKEMLPDQHAIRGPSVRQKESQGQKEVRLCTALTFPPLPSAPGW